MAQEKRESDPTLEELAAHYGVDLETMRVLLSHSGQDEDWPAWYAAYLVAEQAGTDLPG
jgi:hypothetical protein